MAITDRETTGLSELTQKEEVVTETADLVGVAGVVGEALATLSPGSSSKVADDASPVGVFLGGDTGDKDSTVVSVGDPANAPRPSLVALGSSNLQGPTPVSHPKRFSAVNINKKFLQKNSSGSGSTPTSSNSTTAKSGGPVSRPSIPPSFSHSRLVTTKLTATPQASSTTGPGWSRPSSATPTLAAAGSASSPNGTSPLLSAAPTPLMPVAPQLPHAGKVIQPQPRAVVAQAGPSQKDVGGGGGGSSSKPVWGNLKSTVATPQRPDVRVQNDFPTAAEVAQVATSVHRAKVADTKEAAETAAASKQARMEEADTFRGVHLDPNAHHWDEMEEDDDNFLDGVIEFGDGRQYKIQSADMPPASQLASTSSPRDASRSRSRLDDIAPPSTRDPTSNIPVSKEERFADDFDRSWPRSTASPANSARGLPPSASGHHPTAVATAVAVPVSPVSSQPIYSPQESSRVLFNERSNRLEPYGNAHRQGQYPSKRANQSEFSISPTESRSGRDFPSPSQAPSNVQLLQKPNSSGNNEFPARARGLSSSTSGGFGPGPLNAWNNDRQRDREPPRRDGMPSSASMPLPQSPRMSRDNYNPFGLASSSSGGRDRDHVGENRGRRTSTMGPPPVPLHSLRGRSKDAGRQLPPHLSQIPPSVPPPQRRLSSRESRFPPPPLGESPVSPVPSTSARFPSQSPALSHASAAPLSPAVEKPPPQLSAPELDEVRKDLMQNAAARAKQRRQQEEEEREKDKERARRKAAELEEKIRVAEAERAKLKEALEAEKASQSQVRAEKVIAIIEDAVKSVGLETSSSEPTIQTLPPPSPFSKPPLRRPPSLKGMPFYPPAEPARPIHPRPPSTSSTTTPAVSTPILAVQAESWRSKASPLPLQTSRQVHARPPIPSFMPPPPSALEQVESLAKDPEEELEVVDFSDLAKFVGVPDAPEDQHVEAIPSSSSLERLSRPIASDFFDDRPAALEVVKNDVVAWRRKGLVDFGMAHPSTFEQQNDTTTTSAKDRPRTDAVAENSFASDAASTTSTKETTPSVDHHHTIPTVNVPPYSGTQRTPRVQTFYKEAAMSALDDTLSRIKGALDGMQAGEAPRDPQHSGSAESETFTASSARPSLPHSHPSVKSSPPKERWVPPALRVRHFDFEPQEVFHVTGCEPPRSPKPAWNAFIVRLPKLSHSLEPPNEKRLRLSTKPPYAVRWDILSFDPPVEGMNRRDLSLNDILFRKQAPFKGRHKYRVLLPRHRGPRVNIPVHTVGLKINGVGTFGRAAGLDGLSTWRKVTSPPSTTIEIRDTMTSEFGLDTMSRSPPPELSSDLSVASMPKSDASIPTKSDGPLVPIRSRSQPKMPAGSAVAFYRDSRIDAVESDPKPLVNFIVRSELEESRQSQSTATPSKPQPSITISSPSSNLLPPPGSSASVGENTSKPLPPMVNGLGSSSASPEHTITSLMQSQAENKSSDNMDDHAPITPPTHHASTWTKSSLSFPVKESPARGPDPEHLKAVWSQAPDKSRLPAVNSLEGIADDLTAIPFTLQDVKSEDGETPPPSTSTAPSRMSLHDVTRAFQQVPSSSPNSGTHRTPLSPPSTSVPVARNTNYAYSLPPPTPSMRPTYAPYGSPMMSHSPSPTVMYPHPMASSPVPSRMPMNGHTPLYSQPVWMPLAAPAAQNHGGMMRPVPSPYPAQLMAYPSPGTPSIYPPPGNMQNPPPQQNGSQQNRGRSMSVMSPAMSHTGTHSNVQMYGSPVLMHAPVMQVQQNHGYIPMPAGRGQVRNDNGHPQMQQHPPPSSHPPQPPHTAYTPVPPTSFVRPSW